MLDSTNCTEHDKELFCKNCHGRKYGPKGYGFGGGAGALSMDSGAQFANQQWVFRSFYTFSIRLVMTVVMQQVSSLTHICAHTQ